MRFIFTKNALGKIRNGLSTLALGLLAAGTTQAEIVSFDVYTNQCDAVINWVSDGNDDTRYFNLQKSEDGVDFSTINTIRRTTSNNYSHTVRQVEKRMFYRIVEVNTSTPIRVSEAKAVKTACNVGIIADTPAIGFYPNPMIASDGGLYVTLENEGGEILDIQIMDITGRIIVKKTSSLYPGDNQVFVGIGDVARGGYLVVTSIDGAAPKASRLIIQ